MSDATLIVSQTSTSVVVQSTPTSIIQVASVGPQGPSMSVNLTTPSFLSVSGVPLTMPGTISVSYSGVPLPAANGGTGVTTLTGVPYGNGTGAMTAATEAQLVAAIGATPVANASAAPWSGVSGKPTTISGYGITDAASLTANQTISGVNTFSNAGSTFAGNAATATNSTNSANVGVTDDTISNTTVYPLWATAGAGNLPVKVTSTKLSFNPSTGVLTSTSFTGAGTGLTGTAASLSIGGNAATSTSSTQLGGVAAANYAQMAVAQNWTATQRPSTGTAAVSTTSTYSFTGAAQVTTVTLTNAITVTMGAPSGLVAGAYYTLVLTAGDTNARSFAWNSAWKFPSGAAPLASGTTTSGASDIVTFLALTATTAAYVGHQADVR